VSHICHTGLQTRLSAAPAMARSSGRARASVATFTEKVWPQQAARTWSGTPAAAIRLFTVCLRSCRRIRCTPSVTVVRNITRAYQLTEAEAMLQAEAVESVGWDSPFKEEMRARVTRRRGAFYGAQGLAALSMVYRACSPPLSGRRKSALLWDRRRQVRRGDHTNPMTIRTSGKSRPRANPRERDVQVTAGQSHATPRGRDHINHRANIMTAQTNAGHHGNTRQR
jgi:hypothetical protein